MAQFVKWQEKQILKKYHMILRNALISIGEDIRDDAKRLCPVKTGRLRASLSVNYSSSGVPIATGFGKINYPITLYRTRTAIERNAGFESDGVRQPRKEEGKFIVVIGTNVEYSKIVHDGSHGRPPRPFLRQALETHRKDIRALAAMGTRIWAYKP